ncbi:MAG: hypothetical protein PF904_19835 [Kiritimatiellae bacterium]|jgi:hypothetical protein|nr:hypothetical protein [Kiritimatiellia bacterium]
MARRAAKRNRKRNVKNTLAWQPFAGVILLVVGVALGYMSYADKNKALQDEIDSKYSELGRLKEQCMREESRWNAMKTSENLEKSMVRHGIDMNLPQSHQIVKMGKDGKPIADQHSVAWFARNRRERGNVVKSTIGL